MNKISLQVLLALAMFATTALAGLIPIKLLNYLSKRQMEDERHGKRAAWILSLLSCFAGGVFMGTCFLDIFPHINENYAKFTAKTQWGIEYPFPQFFICCGFFLVYLLEELTLKVFASSEDGGSVGHGHSHGGSASGNSLHRHHHQGECMQEPLKTGGGNGISEGSKSAKNSASMKSTTAVSLNGGAATAIRASAIAMGGSDDLDSSIQSINPFRRQRSISVVSHEVVIDESLKYMGNGERVDGSFLKSLTFAIAMSFHSVLEGFALGVQENNTGIMTLFISLIIHKGIEAFSVGLQITRSNAKRLFVVVLTIIVYALMTPFGSLVGVLITNLDIHEVVKDGIVLILESLAGGTFIYVTFFEVLAQERANNHSNLIQLSAIVTGFLVISVIQLNESMSEKAIEDAVAVNNEAGQQ